MDQLPAEVAALLQAGAYAEAARALRRLGDLERAQALYEKVWDFAAAADVAAERGDRPEHLRLLIEAKDLPRAAQVGREIQQGTVIEQERAARVYEHKRMWPEAAALWEAVGAREHARELYRRAQLLLEVARLEEALGRPREAGMAYERFLAAEPRSPDAPRAALGLARILGDFGRHDEAVRYLQRALRTLAPQRLVALPFTAADDDTAPPAPARAAEDPAKDQLVRALRRQLVLALAALGYTSAARRQLDALRAEDPALPALEPFLADAEARRAAQRPAGLPENEQLLGGRYQVRHLLGSGGMGRVYHARDRLTTRDVAVKVVAAPVDPQAQLGFQRFLREARVVSALRHPHIVAVLDFHAELGLLVMEYMAGGTVADRLHQGLAPSTARKLLLQVIAGLQAAHAHGVIHRDIKPANIFLTASGEAKLGDFGVAHLQDLGATQTGGFIGTLAYMSPEQITGAPLTFACDVYALGVTAFQMLTGQLPFAGPDFIGQHLGALPPRVSSLRPELSAFDGVVARMLAKDPAERFTALDELERALGAIPLAERVIVRSQGQGQGSSAPAASAADTPATSLRDAGERYRSDALLRETPISRIERGIDQRLGRAILIERFQGGYLASEAGARQLAWLRVMARHGGPHLQRVLRIEPALDRVIYEAPLGTTPAPPLTPAATLRLLRDLGRALAGPHGEGTAHGALAPETIVLEESGATLLVAGCDPAGRGPADDLADLLALAQRLSPGLPLPDPAERADAAALAAWAEARRPV